MDKLALKKFAVAARRRLREQVGRKAQELGAAVGCLDETVERIAHLWFNRFIALRYMEVNGCLDRGIRVLSSSVPGKPEPDLLTQALTAELPLDRDKVRELLEKNEPEPLYRYLLLAQCRALGETLPFLFGAEEDLAERLLPDSLLGVDSVLRLLVDEIDEADWKQGVEIIGWLHQHYVSERKDEAFAGLQRNEKIAKELVPAATQLFTPAWIVKYMVENSLGSMWLETHPDKALKKKWKYLINDAVREEEARSGRQQERKQTDAPERIKVLDPACGSGHILVYVFDVLHDIYCSAGYPERDIPGLILEKNIYGLDIDDRAVQLACFSLMMKAREKNPDIVRERPKLNIVAFEESGALSPDVRETLLREAGGQTHAGWQTELLLDTFRHARLLGSILDVEQLDLNFWTEKLKGSQHLQKSGLGALVRQAKLLADSYHVIVTNPPYMGRKGMNRLLADYVSRHYPLSQNDLFAVFLEKTVRMLAPGGWNAAINQQSWMFLSSYEELRKKLLRETSIRSMLHLGPRAFDEIGGEVVQSTAFVLRKLSDSRTPAIYCRLTDCPSPQAKEAEFLHRPPGRLFAAAQESFSAMPGSPIVYWATPQVRRLFAQLPGIGTMFEVKKGMDTGNNELFLRYWYEVDCRKLGRKWVPYQKGGEFRRWYGNQLYVVDWEDDGRNIRQYAKSNLRNKQYYFQPGITWSTVSTSAVSFRKFSGGQLFDNGGSCLFGRSHQHDSMLAFLNSKVPQMILYQINPTFNYQPGDIAKIPLHPDVPGHPELSRCGAENAEIARQYWDSQEISRDFARHPWLRWRQTGLMEEAWRLWSEHLDDQRRTLQANEEAANRLLIGMYGLTEELTPEVAEQELAVRKETAKEGACAFISYAVGCMLGRYSLDQEGLVFAGGEFDPSRYAAFPAVGDGIILMPAEGDSFGNDASALFARFVEIAFGAEHLRENLDFIAKALGKSKNETSAGRIRTYFMDAFYKDHVRIYRKRPIYWLFRSGKEKAFQAVVYMHRYDASTLARLREDYLAVRIKGLQSEIRRLAKDREPEPRTDRRGRRKAEPSAARRLAKLARQLEELEAYDERLRRYAASPPQLNPDDGVRANYRKLAELLAPIG